MLGRRSTARSCPSLITGHVLLLRWLKFKATIRLMNKTRSSLILATIAVVVVGILWFWLYLYFHRDWYRNYFQPSPSGPISNRAVIARSDVSGQSAVTMGIGTDHFSLRGSNLGNLLSDGGSGVDALDSGLNGSADQNGNSFDAQPVYTAWEHRLS